jgi:stage II sporulation protein GA (sporulation sigma-E factor processing peptidase)
MVKAGVESVIVYVDLIFLTNVCFDATILMITARLRKNQISRWRVAGASILGAVYAVLMVFPIFAILYTVIAKLLFSILIVFVAYGFGSLQHFMRNLGAFYLVHFVAAGAMFAIHFFWLSSGEVMNSLLLQPSGSTAFAIETGLWIALPSFLITLWLLRSVFITAKRTEIMDSYTAEVSVEIDGHQRSCLGLVDTGNQLYDPLTRVPVMVMESEQWKDMLPESWLLRIRSGEIDEILAGLGQEPFPLQDRLRFVPYRGINKGTQLMLAIKPDKVTISLHPNMYEASKVLIALDGGKLSASGAYQAIIHPMMLEK